MSLPRFKRSKSLIAVAAAALLALSACSSGGDSGSGTESNGSSSTGTQAAGDPVSGQTLTWALEKSPVTLNPHFPASNAPTVAPTVEPIEQRQGDAA